MKVDKEVLDLSLEWISYDDLRIEETGLSTSFPGLWSKWAYQINPPAYEDFVDNTFIDKAK